MNEHDLPCGADTTAEASRGFSTLDQQRAHRVSARQMVAPFAGANGPLLMWTPTDRNQAELADRLAGLSLTPGQILPFSAVPEETARVLAGYAGVELRDPFTRRPEPTLADEPLFDPAPLPNEKWLIGNGWARRWFLDRPGHRNWWPDPDRGLERWLLSTATVTLTSHLQALADGAGKWEDPWWSNAGRLVRRRYREARNLPNRRRTD
jgi:hypothetical protein